MKRSTQILDRSDDLPHFPVLNETYHEIMYESLDLVQAKNVLERLGPQLIIVRASSTGIE